MFTGQHILPPKGKLGLLFWLFENPTRGIWQPNSPSEVWSFNNHDERFWPSYRLHDVGEYLRISVKTIWCFVVLILTTSCFCDADNLDHAMTAPFEIREWSAKVCIDIALRELHSYTLGGAEWLYLSETVSQSVSQFVRHPWHLVRYLLCAKSKGIDILYCPLLVLVIWS